MKLICTIPAHAIQYEIEIADGILFSQAAFLKSLASKFVIISDDRIGPLHGNSLKENLTSQRMEVHLLSIPTGEEYKTRATKEHLENQLFEKRCGRDTCVIALGGGVVTDLVGYVAATYCRGVPYVMIPTSLLGMVDASIGGKTGVNVPHGKNMLGCIYQPKKVVIDLSLLDTLPKKEFANGMVETIKHALIANASFFEELEKQSDIIADKNALQKVVYKSCSIKKEIVEHDEKEKGKRFLLNFGHTVGHALEHLTDYAISHGEAVAIGIIVESYISVMLGILDEESFNRIRQIFVQYKLPLTLPKQFPIQTLLEAMSLDKKSLKGKPRFVILEKIGKPHVYDNEYCTHVDEALIVKALQWMYDLFS